MIHKMCKQLANIYMNDTTYMRRDPLSLGKHLDQTFPMIKPIWMAAPEAATVHGKV